MPVIARLFMLISGLVIASALTGQVSSRISAATVEYSPEFEQLKEDFRQMNAEVLSAKDQTDLEIHPTFTPTPTISVTPAITVIPTRIIPTKEPQKISGSPEANGVYLLINEYRKANGRGELAVHEKLVSSAQAKAQDMISKNYWGHVSPDGVADWDFFRQAGYPFTHAGENLADNYFSAFEVFNAWKASGPHNQNMLLPEFTEMGVAFVCNIKFHNYENTCLTVLHLGSRT